MLYFFSSFKHSVKTTEWSSTAIVSSTFCSSDKDITPCSELLIQVIKIKDAKNKIEIFREPPRLVWGFLNWSSFKKGVLITILLIHHCHRSHHHDRAYHVLFCDLCLYVFYVLISTHLQK